MNNFLFKDRDGHTPLPAEFRKGLIPKHIQTVGELDEYEERNIAKGLAWLDGQTSAAAEYVFWTKLHKKLFNEVWTWSGEIREHELDNPGFSQPHAIRGALRQLEGDVAYWMKEKSFSEKEIAARFHERMERIHPFANGNGRFGRILIEYFCVQNGWPVPAWGHDLRQNPSARRRAYVDALESSRRDHDYSPLVLFMHS